MNIRTLSQRLTKRAYRIVRVLVQSLSVFIILLVCAFVFLRLYGVPEPLLREVLRRTNLAGIPVDVEEIRLTLRGWRASNVRYYSNHPDDLEPIFKIQEVLFSKQTETNVDSSTGWKLEINAKGILMHPSAEWGVEIPLDSKVRVIDQATLSLDFLSDRIVFSNGSLSWLDTQFFVSGTVLKSEQAEPSPEDVRKNSSEEVEKQTTVSPVYVNAQQFQVLEDRLKVIRLEGESEVNIDFLIDTGNYAASRLDFTLKATDFYVREVGFSEAEVSGYYLYPRLELGRASLSREEQSVWLAGGYNLETGEINGELVNEITSKRMLLLLPQAILNLLAETKINFEYLPQLSLHFAPCQPAELLNNFGGTFSVRELTYCQLVIEELYGNILRSNGRLELTDLEGTTRGQENRAEAFGSCMTGGSATGEVFWDLNTHEFGVSASGSMDPNLFMEPLSMLEVATNVMTLFKFEGQSPIINLDLGGCYLDVSTFFINIQGMGNDVRLRDVLLSSFSASAYYKLGVLRLDPISAMQGADFMKGTAEIYFNHSRVTFDTFGSMHPAELEGAIHPAFKLFGNKIKTAGNVHIKAAGVLDWGRMQTTDFTAEVEADQLEIPVAKLDNFSAVITGAGPLISLIDTSFNFYGGTGVCDFAIQLDPYKKEKPYEMDFEVSDTDFRACLQFLNPTIGDDFSGVLAAKVHVEADMAEDFFTSANGIGQVSVVEGQLTDLPLFRGFSKLMRKVVPGFNIFSITSLRGNFELQKGIIHTQDAYFEGNVISAKGEGLYSEKDGFDARVQVQMMSENSVSKIIRVITDPFLKLFKLELSGSLKNPSWRLEKFTIGDRDSESD